MGSASTPSSAIFPSKTIPWILRRQSISSCSQVWQARISSGIGLLSGGAQRQTAVIYRSRRRKPSPTRSARGLLAKPARYSAGYRKSPEASPVNILPVRLEPCAPGASPTANTHAFGSPKPGTGLPQYCWSWKARRFCAAICSRQATRRGHLRH